MTIASNIYYLCHLLKIFYQINVNEYTFSITFFSMTVKVSIIL